MIDPVTYMTQRERSADVAAADAAYGAAVKALLDAVPADLLGQVLDLECAASGYAVALAEAYFFGGLRLGLCPAGALPPMGRT